MDMVRHKQGIQRLKQTFENADTVQKVRTADLADLRTVDEAMCWETRQMVILPHTVCSLPPWLQETLPLKEREGQQALPSDTLHVNTAGVESHARWHLTHISLVTFRREIDQQKNKPFVQIKFFDAQNSEIH